MRARRTPLAGLLVGLLVAGTLAACGGGPAASPTPTPDPSAGPVIDTDTAFCEALDVMSSEHQILRQIRLRPTNRRQLDDQFEQLQLAWQDMVGVAPDGLQAQLAAMRWAVIDLGIAVEDYTTTFSRFAEASEHVLREDIAFARTLGRLRARTTCPAWEPTPKPQREPSPGPSDGASPAPSG
jgi:hypothetical protein